MIGKYSDKDRVNLSEKYEYGYCSLVKATKHQITDFCIEPKSTVEIMDLLGWRDRTKFRNKYITPLIEIGILEMTIPDKPNSRLQKYRLTILGKQLKDQL